MAGLRVSQGCLFKLTVQYSRYQKMTIYDRISIIFLTPKDQPQQATKKRKRHACQTSINTHPSHAPEGRPRQGSRSSRVTNLSIQLSSKTATAILADRARGPKGIHSRVSRIYTHQPGWDLWLFWRTKRRSNTIEMIL